MKINIEDYLQKIDSSFKDKSQKDIYMIYIMIFSVIFAISYQFFWDTSEASFTQQRAQVVATEKKITNDTLFLQHNPASKITQIINETKHIQNQIIVFKDNNQYIKIKIEEISSLIYDEQTWGKYLHNISTNAKKNNVKILKFTNNFVQSKKDFGHMLDINMQITGKYRNTINFINSLEQSDLVVDLHTLEMKAEKKLNTDLNISVWGITY